MPGGLGWYLENRPPKSSRLWAMNQTDLTNPTGSCNLAFASIEPFHYAIRQAPVYHPGHWSYREQRQSPAPLFRWLLQSRLQSRRQSTYTVGLDCSKRENARERRVSLPSLIQGIQAGLLGKKIQKHNVCSSQKLKYHLKVLEQIYYYC